jgi:soluble lytic murein transglycosylase-like protein
MSEKEKLINNIYALYKEPIDTVAEDLDIPKELILATIATESAGQAQAKRYEPAFYERYIRNNKKYKHLPWFDEPERISSSYGLMQIMYTTALAMGFPEELEPEDLCDPYTNIHFGCLYVLHQKAQTNLEPIKVTAAYNAGSLRPSDEPPYYLHATIGHIARFMGYWEAARNLRLH